MALSFMFEEIREIFTLYYERQLAQTEERSTGLKSRNNGMRMRRSRTTRTVSFILYNLAKDVKQ